MRAADVVFSRISLPISNIELKQALSVNPGWLCISLPISNIELKLYAFARLRQIGISLPISNIELKQ